MTGQTTHPSTGFDFSQLMNRIKSVFFETGTFWSEVKDDEPTNVQGIITTLLLPLATLSAICVLIGSAFVGISIMGIHTKTFFFPTLLEQIVRVAITCLWVFAGAKLLCFLAPKFEGQTTEHHAAKLLTFTLYPSLFAGIFTLVPMGLITFVAMLISLYGFYVYFKGCDKMVTLPASRKTGFFFASIACLILFFFALGLITSLVLPATTDASQIQQQIMENFNLPAMMQP